MRLVAFQDQNRFIKYFWRLFDPYTFGIVRRDILESAFSTLVTSDVNRKEHFIFNLEETLKKAFTKGEFWEFAVRDALNREDYALSRSIEEGTLFLNSSRGLKQAGFQANLLEFARRLQSIEEVDFVDFENDEWNPGSSIQEADNQIWGRRSDGAA